MRFELNNDRWAAGVNTSERSLPWLRKRERERSGRQWHFLTFISSFKVFFVAFNVNLDMIENLVNLEKIENQVNL